MNRFVLSLMALLCAAAVNAVPAYRGTIQYKQPDGSTLAVRLVGDEFFHYYVDARGEVMLPDADGRLCRAQLPDAREAALQSRFAKRAAGAMRAAGRADAAAPAFPQQGLGRFTSAFPRTGKVRSLVFLVEYANVKFTVANPKEYFSKLLNDENVTMNGATGSARDYFLAQSNGLFDVTFDVCGPVKLSQNRAYYGANLSNGDDAAPEKMVLEAAQALDGEIDFSEYDYDGNGYVDNIFVIYAGTGEASGGPAESVWPHSWEIPVDQQIKLDDKIICGYACSNEWESYLSAPCGIGTVVHEFSHVMGLPDLYSTVTTLSCTPGSWSVMDYGSYNNDGNTPPCYSAFERNAMGWLDATVLDGAESVTLEHIASSNHACVIPVTDTEFFLLENRQQHGWDEYLPGHGMLVWHIDFTQDVWDDNKVNNNSRHQYVDIVEANSNPNNSNAAALAGYPFPGTSRVTSLTADTNPALKGWGSVAIDVPITGIEERDGVISFDVCGGVIEFEQPAAPELSADEEGRLTVSWARVPRAEEYVVNIFTKNDAAERMPFGVYTDYVVADTALVVDGLASRTEYFATVLARAGVFASEPSSEGSVSSGEVPFTGVRPTALGARADNEGTTVFGWVPVNDADHYLITVTTPWRSGTRTEVLDFGVGDQVSLPEGWAWNGDVNIGIQSYAGQSAPSLKFTSGGHALLSPEYRMPLCKVSFWLRGISAYGKSAILVQSSIDGEDWETVRRIVLVDEAKVGDVFTVTLPDTARRLRIFYDKEFGNAVLDDLTLTIEGLEDKIVNGFDAVDAGSGDECTFVLPVLLTDPSYTVTAVAADGTRSLPSAPASIKGFTGVTAPAVAAGSDAPVQYYNMQGMPVVNPTPGLYLRRQGNVVSKVVITE